MPRLCYLLLLLCLPCSAEVYTYLDEAGNRVYTDRPLRDNAEQVQLAPLNELPPPLIRPPAALLPQQAPAPSYVLLRIITPEPDAVIRDMTGNLIVTANSDPALLPGHSYRLLLDGAAVGEPGRSPVFPLENLDRGEHQLAVEIINQRGITLERTPNQPVHIKRTSLHAKRLAKPCKIDDYGVRPECPLKEKPVIDNDIPYVPFF